MDQKDVAYLAVGAARGDLVRHFEVEPSVSERKC